MLNNIYFPVLDCCDSPSLPQGPPSSGATLPLSPQSAESTRGQQTAKHDSASTNYVLEMCVDTLALSKEP